MRRWRGRGPPPLRLLPFARERISSCRFVRPAIFCRQKVTFVRNKWTTLSGRGSAQTSLGLVRPDRNIPVCRCCIPCKCQPAGRMPVILNYPSFTTAPSCKTPCWLQLMWSQKTKRTRTTHQYSTIHSFRHTHREPQQYHSSSCCSSSSSSSSSSTLKYLGLK